MHTEGTNEGRQTESSTNICMLPCVKHSWWEAAVKHRELSMVLCDDLVRWGRSGEGSSRQRGYMLCILIADSLCCTAETNRTL